MDKMVHLQLVLAEVLITPSNSAGFRAFAIPLQYIEESMNFE